MDTGIEVESARSVRPAPQETTGQLLRALLLLAAPVLAEQLLHGVAGLSDTYIANNMIRIPAGASAETIERAHQQMTAAGAAVGTISYLLWFVGLLAAAVGTGSTAIIARATGARHRRLANSICGQSIGVAALAGLGLMAAVLLLAEPIARLTRLPPAAMEYARQFLIIVAPGLPFLVVLMVANACLRGAGDTITPAVAMVIVDIVNVAVAFALTFGWFGLPALGFRGIAVGAVSSYIVGGTLQILVLLVGRGGIRLFVHRLRPHWHHLRRLLRIGLPSAAESGVMWGTNFVLIQLINAMDGTAASGAAHAVTVRIEAFSYLTGFALAIAATTMVGQSLGMNDPRRAERSALLAFAVAGSTMVAFGVSFILFGGWMSQVMSEDPTVVALTDRCLFITGFAQLGFAAAIVFSGSLRGAGDTLSVLLINLCSLVGVRLVGVLLLIHVFAATLPVIWVLLSAELWLRGMAMFARFRHGGWKRIRV